MNALLHSLLTGRAWPVSARAAASLYASAEGLWWLEPACAASTMRPLVLSAAIHGDETAPVELLCDLAEDWAAGRAALHRPLLLMFGNLPALRAGRRYIDADLNRQFGDERMADNPQEAARAAELRSELEAFYARYGSFLHLDLHSTIRPSRHRCFAIHPEQQGNAADTALLAACGIEALLSASAAGPTLSAWTVRRFGAASYTLELGQVRALGSGTAGEFAALRASLYALVAAQALPNAAPLALQRYRVTREILKQSGDFRFELSEALENFMPLQAGCLIARDGAQTWHAAAGERLVFPNPDVRPGLRAAVLVQGEDGQREGGQGDEG